MKRLPGSLSFSYLFPFSFDIQNHHYCPFFFLYINLTLFQLQPISVIYNHCIYYCFIVCSQRCCYFLFQCCSCLFFCCLFDSHFFTLSLLGCFCCWYPWIYSSLFSSQDGIPADDNTGNCFSEFDVSMQNLLMFCVPFHENLQAGCQKLEAQLED